MTVKSDIRGILGKTITGVLVSANPRQPPTQLFLVFSDGTFYEIYGQLSSAGGLDQGGMAGAEKYATMFQGKQTKYEPGGT